MNCNVLIYWQRWEGGVRTHRFNFLYFRDHPNILKWPNTTIIISRGLTHTDTPTPTRARRRRPAWRSTSTSTTTTTGRRQSITSYPLCTPQTKSESLSACYLTSHVICLLQSQTRPLPWTQREISTPARLVHHWACCSLLYSLFSCNKVGQWCFPCQWWDR